MPRIHTTRWRGPAALAAVAAAFVAALVAPIPALPDAGRTAVEDEVSSRLPGWTIERLQPSWEGAYAVVTNCAGKRVSFQFVPGHGLPRDDAWLQPSNDFTRSRLTAVSDDYRYLLWRGEPRQPERLSCMDELARSGEVPGPERIVD